MDILIYLLIGAAVGWVAGKLMRGRGFGLIGNTIVGVLGGFVGGYLTDLMDFNPGEGVIGKFIGALLGALVLLFIVGFFKRTTH